MDERHMAEAKNKLESVKKAQTDYEQAVKDCQMARNKEASAWTAWQTAKDDLHKFLNEIPA